MDYDIKEYDNIYYAPNRNECNLNRESKDFHVIGDKDNPKWIRFACPCGCKNIIDINLMKSANPHWDLTIRDDKVTIHPSIDASQALPCKSHFWITDSKVC